MNYNLCKIVNPNSDEMGINVHRILQNEIGNHCFKSENDKIKTIENLCGSLKR